MRGKPWAHLMLWPATFLAWWALFAIGQNLFAWVDPSSGLIARLIEIIAVFPIYILVVFGPIVLHQVGKTACSTPARRDRLTSFEHDATPQKVGGARGLVDRLRGAAA